MDVAALPPLIDSHCHLNYDYSPKSASDLIREAQAEGVQALVTIGTDIASLDAIIAISEANPAVYHTVGVHPHEAIDYRDEHDSILRAASAHPKCRAIGEIGLDYHYDHSPREIQRAVLDRQLKLAIETGQPVVIHSRDAEPDLLNALKGYAAQVPAGQIPGVIHCFSGSMEFGQACIDLGFFISFSGILTFKKAEELRECAKAFPIEAMMVETDAPYLAPIPFRGRKCEPAMVKHTAQRIAELKSLAYEAVAEATTRNARRFFRID